MPPKIAPLSGPRTAPPKPVRDRTKMRASGMRFEVGPGGGRSWVYVNGTNGGAHKLGYGRVTHRRHLRQTEHKLKVEIEKLAEIGEGVSRAAVGLE